VKVRDGATSRTKLELNPNTAPVVKRIFRDCLAGNGLKAIVRSLNADGIPTATGKQWGATSVEKILHNEAYTGTLVWGKRTKSATRAQDGCVPLRTESAWPALVDQDTFAQAQDKLAARAHQVIHPRVVDSPYLLSGMIRCGQCGAALVGQGNGQGYRYYMCGNAHRKGREICPSPLLPKNKLERFIIDRIRGYILTEENLEDLVRLTNEELAQTSGENRRRLELLQTQIAEVESRLGKLYDALETGEFRSDELAPRIQALSKRKEELQQAKAEVEEKLSCEVMEMADPQVVRDYANDLGNLLTRSSITEQRSFLKSFVERIEAGSSEIKLYYTIPILPLGTSDETVGVSPFVHHGKRRGGRTLKEGLRPS